MKISKVNEEKLISSVSFIRVKVRSHLSIFEPIQYVLPFL